MARCTHPYASITFDDPTRPRCDKCKKVLPSAITMKKAPPDLVRVVRSFLGYIKAGEGVVEQADPRIELKLILQMADALNQVDAGPERVVVRKLTAE